MTPTQDWAKGYLDIYRQIEQKEDWNYELARLAKAILAESEDND